MAKKKSAKQKVTFSILAPAARNVQLVGDFSGWQQHPVDLKQLKNGEWKATLPLSEGKYEYRYIVDGQWSDDPNCSMHVPNSFGSQNCVIIVA